MSFITFYNNLHEKEKSFMEVFKNCLTRHSIFDIKYKDAIILFQIGNNKMMVVDIAKTIPFTTNITYSLKILEKNSYITNDYNPADRRSRLISLTKKGLSFLKIVDAEKLF